MKFRAVQCLLLVCTSTFIDAENLVKWRTYESSTPVFQVLFSTSRFLYVGGRNKLLELDQDLKLVREINIGPVRNKDNAEEDNDVKIMLFNKDNLFICGSALNQSCHYRSQANIATNWIPSGIGNDIIISVNNVALLYNDSSKEGFYVANSNDGTDIHSFRPSISSRKEERICLIEKFGFSGTAGIDTFVNPFLILSDSSVVSNVRFIYGFSYEGFGYFLLTQRVTSGKYETRLARVCDEDRFLYSYSEIPLTCSSQSGESYNLATTGYLGEVTRKLENRLNIASNGKALYIVFGRNDDGQEPVSSFGSILCTFPMQEVDKVFYNVTRDCLNGDPGAKPIEKFLFSSGNCKKEEGKEKIIQDALCHAENKTYIEGLHSLTGWTATTLDKVAVSLAVVIQQIYTVAFLITTQGSIIKWVLDKGDEPGFVYDVPLDGDVGPEVRISNAMDSEKENLYLLSGKKVIKFPIGSCSLHSNCSVCIENRDSLDCGWCEDHCATRQECSQGSFQKEQCAPVVYQVSPLRGHIKGGTRLTITGDNLGSKKDGIETEISVKVAGVPCAIEKRTHQTVECRIAPRGLSSSSGFVTVFVKETSRIFQASFPTRFSYVLPKLFGFSPGYGPVSGGTMVTLLGKDLDIGSDREVILDGFPCPITQISHSSINCTSGRGPSDNSKSAVILKIDGNKLDFDEKEKQRRNLSNLFEYRPDPVVFNVTPNVSILSGGINLIVTGRHLDSTARPKLVVSVVHSTEKRDIVQECFPGEPLGERLLCRIPSLASIGVNLTGNATAQTLIHFLMDGASSVRDVTRELLYLPDPFFQTLPHNSIQFMPNKTEILIKGRDLNLALRPEDYNVIFNHTIPCAVTQLTHDTLRCVLPEELREIDVMEPFPVTVQAGNLDFKIERIPVANSSEQRSDNSFSQPWSTGTIAGVLIAAVFLLSVIFLVLYKFRRVFKPFNKRNSEYCDVLNSPTQGRAVAYNNYQMGGIQINEETRLVLTDYNILFSRDCLTLGEKIGQGQFGCVYKGELLIPSEIEGRQVAVKTLHNSRHLDSVSAEHFLKEGLIMKDFHHRHVLTLIGVCFEDTGLPMIILPFMKHGDLKAYIQDEANEPTIRGLIEFGIQVVEGMEYLSNLKFVHRDLAARNCMLDEDMLVKVADFGLSRDVYEREYYSSDNKKDKLPVKWMAPESLEKGTYTSKSDVWSFGVLLWELMTRGVTPYPEVGNWEILNYIKTGRRMMQPSYCPDMLFQIMLKCWSEDPENRPTFLKLADEIRAVLKKMENKSKKVSLKGTYVHCPVEQESIL